MKPDWSALTALARSMFVLFAATFVGVLALPVTAAGELPVSWAAWRPVLATAATAAIVAEIAFARSHLQQWAQALGLLPTPAAAAKIAGAALLLLFVGCIPPAASADIGQVAACVIQQLESSDDPGQIAAACGPATIQDVIEIVTALVSDGADAGSPLSDAKLRHARAIHAGAGK